MKQVWRDCGKTKRSPGRGRSTSSDSLTDALLVIFVEIPDDFVLARTEIDRRLQVKNSLRLEFAVGGEGLEFEEFLLVLAHL